MKKNAICPIVIMLFFALALVSLGTHADAAPEKDVFAPREIAADAPCGKCGMFPARYPQWQSQIVFSDGTMTPFDGCKCMFGFLFNMEKYDPAHTPEDIARIWVRDFNSGDWIEADQAHYVIGGTVTGPMGKELIPFREKSSAEAFRKVHGGQFSSFEAVNVDTLIPLMHMMHMKGGTDQQGQMHK